ncbi:MAG: ubiquinol-cytochrome c reductase iron-sulfur subunit [Emcibacteraceae bacterium]|nr:ubiquinol-cytochrome c reductase iron-sulfur subunit [Emcibacteraceae bacterium]
MTTHENVGEERRNFLYLATTAVGAVAAGGAVWPLVDQMNPAKNVLALSSIEVDLNTIPEGQSAVFLWRGNPVFVRHRTADEIAEATADDTATDLIDPENDADRVQKPEWLVMSGVCTHLGCVPLDQKGEFGGWYCPCHGSHYDISGRIRKGPAPTNLPVMEYVFLDDSTIQIG